MQKQRYPSCHFQAKAQLGKSVCLVAVVISACGLSIACHTEVPCVSCHAASSGFAQQMPLGCESVKPKLPT